MKFLILSDAVCDNLHQIVKGRQDSLSRLIELKRDAGEQEKARWLEAHLIAWDKVDIALSAAANPGERLLDAGNELAMRSWDDQRKQNYTLTTAVVMEIIGRHFGIEIDGNELIRRLESSQKAAEKGSP